jgi:anti-anti-sigma regulatory factor
MNENPSAKIEYLLRKAAEDPQFKELLLAERSRAAQRIGVVLDVSEAALLDSVVEKQLAAMIAKARRGPEKAPGKSFVFQLKAVIDELRDAATCASGIRVGIPSRILGIRPDVKRTLESTDILRLPIMALRKRIEQEMNENPLLEMQEQEPTVPDEPNERDNPDVPADS